MPVGAGDGQPPALAEHHGQATSLIVMRTHIIAYFSPAGTTRQLAQWIAERLAEKNQEIRLIDLGQQGDLSQIVDTARAPACLWIGSPVYCDHAVPLVHDAIATLPASSSGHAIPFVTWGGVTSGLALLEMATQLRQQNWPPLAAAKILAVHSSMWRTQPPLAYGHPDKNDQQLIQQLVDRVLEILHQKPVPELPLHRLDYLSPELQTDACTKNLEIARSATPPFFADEKRCQQCGACAEACPVSAITLVPFPVINRTACVLCLQCIRSCPHEAFPFDHKQVATRILAMAAASDEEKRSQIFS